MCHFFSGRASAAMYRCVSDGHTRLVPIYDFGAARRRASAPWETSVIPPRENASTALLAAAWSRNRCPWDHYQVKGTLIRQRCCTFVNKSRSVERKGLVFVFFTLDHVGHLMCERLMFFFN